MSVNVDPITGYDDSETDALVSADSGDTRALVCEMISVHKRHVLRVPGHEL